MHAHGPGTEQTKRVLRLSLGLTFAYILLTLVVGLRANSLALLSEAGHNTSDFLALLMSFVAVYLHTRPATDRKTFGYRRAGVLAAFVNALALMGISCWLAVEAVGRLLRPLVVEPKLMMATAGVGVLMNGILAWMLSRVSRDVNIRGAMVHMLGDTLSTAAVIIGGAVIAWTGMQWVDPVLSIFIAVIIFWSSLSIVRETLNVLLEGTPEDLSLVEIRTEMQTVAGVCGVHDLHVWSLGSNLHALACHVTISDIPPSESRRILEDLNHILREHFHIHHSTIQFEKRDESGCAVEDGCLPVGEGEIVTHSHSHGHSH